MQAESHSSSSLFHIAYALLLAAWTLTGCASSEGPEVVTITAAQYPAAFDAAVQAAREQGMPAVLRDRRSGVIETDPRFAGSLLEPWRTDNASFDQAAENTLAFQRRRARFEFAPAGFQETAQPDHAAAAPNLVGGGEPLPDLTQMQGDMELRVWVYVERATTLGLRRSTWTRSKTTSAILVEPEGQTKQNGPTYWTAASRDSAYERRLLAAVQAALASPPSPSNAK